MLAGDAPQVALLNGPVTLGEWADLGLLHQFDAIAEAGKWERLLHPSLMALVQPRGHVIAAPLGVHRMNTLFYNRKLLAQFDIAPPQTWAASSSTRPCCGSRSTSRSSASARRTR